MVKSCSPPSFHKHRNNNNDKQQWSFEKRHVHKCEFCHKVFPSGQALGGHKTCHRSKKQIHDDDVDDDHRVNKGYKTMKVDFSLSSSPSNHNNHDTKQKRDSSTRVWKGTFHHPPTASEPCEQDELPAVDLLSLLPPRSYNTKKRSRRYLIHHGLANNTPQIPLLDTSRDSVVDLDANHGEHKRMKLSSNDNDNEKMEKPFVLPTSDRIDETAVKETAVSEGETVAESHHESRQRVVWDFDLNELPTNDECWSSVD